MQNWQKDLLTHDLLIRNNIEKSIIDESTLKSLSVIEKGYLAGKISQDTLLKARNIVLK